MDKIKAFFSKTVVKVIAWVLLAVCAVVLMIGGTSVEELSGEMILVGGIVTAVAALVAFICERVKK